MAEVFTNWPGYWPSQNTNLPYCERCGSYQPVVHQCSGINAMAVDPRLNRIAAALERIAAALETRKRR